MKRIRNFVLALAISLSGFALAPIAAQAAAPTPTQTACSAVTGHANCNDNSAPSVGKLVKSAIKILSILIGIAAVIMIIVGGLRYVTSNGDANAISGAKNTIIYAVIGLVVAAVAQALVKFVLKNVT